MHLLKMKIRNFKGTEHEKIMFGNSNKVDEIIRPNGLGKTTMLDAYMWVMAGKKMDGIKPYDQYGNIRLGLEPDVTVTFLDDDGNKHIVRKVLKEKKTRRKGGKPEYCGDRYEFYINGSKVKAKEVELYLPYNHVEMLSDIFCLPNMHWEERRQILIETLVPDDFWDQVPDMIPKVIVPDKFDIPLTSNIAINSLGNLISYWHDEGKKAKGKAEAKETALTEIERIIQDIAAQLSGDDIDKIKKELANKKDELHQAQKELAALTSGALKHTYELERELAHKKEELASLEKKITSKANAELAALQDRKTKAEVVIGSLETSLEWTVGELARKRHELETLRKQYEEASYEITEVAEWNECPYCNSKLIDASRNALQAYLGHKIQSRLKELEEQGIDTKELLEQLEAKKKKVKKSLASQRKILEDVNKRIEEIEKQSKINSPEIQAIMDYISKLEAKITELSGGSDDSLDAEVEKQKAKLQDKIESLQAEAQQFEEAVRIHEDMKKHETRKTELNDKISAYYGEYDNACAMKDKAKDTLAYIADKISVFINKHFKEHKIKFEMFKRLKSGELKPACDIYVDGVPWPKVNHAGQIAAGINMVDVLQKQKGVLYPVWVDNAESIQVLPDNDIKQLILLKVGYPE